MSAPTIPTTGGNDAMATAIALDQLQQSIPLIDGQHAELRHLLDADPDTALRLPGVAHPKENRA